MNLITPIDEPFAYATRKGFREGVDAPGNFFRYFATRAAAEKSIAWMERNGRWHGPIVERPGESQIVGYA